VKVGGLDGVAVHTDFVVIDDQDDAACSILMGLPWLRSIGGIIDTRNNKLEVMKDAYTKVSIPAMKVVRARAVPALGPVSITEEASVSGGDGHGNGSAYERATVRLLRGIQKRRPPSKEDAANFLEILELAEAMGKFSEEPRSRVLGWKDAALDIICTYSLRIELSISQMQEFYNAVKTVVNLLGKANMEEEEGNCSESGSDTSKSSSEDEEDLPDLVSDSSSEEEHMGEREDIRVMLVDHEQIMEELRMYQRLEEEEGFEDGYALHIGNTKTVDAPDFIKVEVPDFPMPVQVGRDTPEHIQKALVEILQKHRGAFALSMEDLQEPARLPPHRIILKEGATPFAARPYKRTPVQEDIIAKMAKDQYKVNILEESASPWCSQAMCLPKKTVTQGF